MGVINISEISSLNFRDDWKLDFQQNVDFSPKFLPSDPVTIQYVSLDLTYHPYLENHATGGITLLSPTLIEEGNGYGRYNLVLSNADIASDTCFSLFFAKSEDGERYMSSDFEVCMELPGTVLLRYTNRRNEKGVVFSESPNFYFRIDGMFLPQETSFENDSEDFRDQRFISKQLSSNIYETKTLTLGGRFGVPNWVARKINLIFSLSAVWVDDVCMARSDGSKVEITMIHNDYPLYIYKIVLEESEPVIYTEGEEVLFARSVDEKKKIIRRASDEIIRTYSALAGEGDALMIRELELIAEISKDYTIEIDDNTSDSTRKVSLSTIIELFAGRFLSKDRQDIAKEMIAFAKGVEFGEYRKNKKGGKIDPDGAAELASLLLRGDLLSDDFLAGMLGTGYALMKRDAEGKSYLEVDKVFARVKAVFAKLEVRKLNYSGGNFVFSPAGMDCVRVEELEDAYRCYFMADDGEEAVENEFRVDDLVQMRTVNMKAGVHGDAGNRYFWRRCVGVGDDYIDLSKGDRDMTSDDAPRAGDSLVTIGNKTVEGRQHAIVISVYGEGAPSFIQYTGVDGYTLEGKSETVISPGRNEFTGSLRLSSSGKRVEDEIRDEVGAGVVAVQAEIDKVAGELAENVEFVTQVADGLEEVRKQVDGAIETWFYEPAPALGNKPAADWTTGALKERHVGDLYYDGGGKAYRFQRAGDGYEWKPIEDTDLAKALADAKRAQDTADGKRRVFVDVPTDASAYDAGDLWVNATYGEYADELLRCKVGKAAGEAWSIGHWERASKYTDDARAEEALAEAAAAKTAAAEAQGAAEDAQGAADKAQASAEEANRLLGDMASDDKLTAQEKQAALKEWEVVVSEYPRNVAAADGYAVARKGYDDAYAALEGYVTPLLAELGVTSDISGAEFRGMFKGYYDARTDLLNGISAKAKELADNAQERADDAVEDAADAKLAADGAMDVAEAAGTRLDNWAGDGVISPVEKQGLRDEAVRIDADMEEVSGGYAKYGLGEPSAFIAAHAGYRGLLELLGASEPEVIGIPGDFAGKQGAYYAARTEALGVIADAAKKAADDAQGAVEGLSVGTRNLITRRHAIITGGADFPEYTGYSSVVNAKGEREVTVECVKEQDTTYFTVYRYSRIEGRLSEKVYEGWYVLSFDYKTDYDGGKFSFDWRSDSSNVAQYSVGIENTNGEWKRGWIVCDFNNDRGFDANIFFVRLYGAKVGNYIAYRNLKLVRGTKGWDDSEAPEDVAAREEAMQEGLDGVKEDVKKVVDKQFEFGTDINGLNGKWEQVTTDIGAISGDVTKVKTEVGDLKASATDFLSRLSSTEKTLEGVQTSVSEIKQDAGSLILRVGGAEKKLGEAWEETSAAISVLKDEINLSVKADGVIASINASTEGVAISGEKVEISGQTVFKDGGGNVVNIFGTGNDVFSINNGVFRVDKSGKAVMKDAEVKGVVVAESGKIGAFNINEYGYLYSGSMVMHDQYIRFKTKDESMVASLGYGGESNSSMLKVNLKLVGAAVRCAQFVGNKNTVLLCEKAGKALAVTGESSFDGLVAFSGFRSVSSGVTLNEGDVFVRCVNSSSITVYLPLNPRTGQMLVFSRNGNSVVLNGNGRSIRYGKSTSTTNTMQNAGGCLLMYDGSYWCVMFFATV